MKQVIINAVVSAIVAIIVVFIGSMLVGNQSAELGASGTRFPNGLSADTTSPVAGQVRGGTFTFTGAGSAVGITNTGTLTQSGVSTFTNTITNTAATSTLGCLRVYQYGATTVASSTFYLMASSTATGGINGSFEVFVTSTKPTYCN